MEASLTGIHNLLFDLGGVIIDLDQQQCVDALEALGDTQAANMLVTGCRTATSSMPSTRFS